MMLEEMGYVTVSEQDTKRVYSITKAGLSFLAERKKAAENAKSQMEKWWRPEIRDKFHEITHELCGIDAKKLEEVQEIIARAHKDIETIPGRNG